MMTTFNNIGFMGFPVIAAAYGNGALIYAVPFSIMFNILCYTWGIQTLCGGGEKGNWKKNYKYRNHKWDYFDCFVFYADPGSENDLFSLSSRTQ